MKEDLIVDSFLIDGLGHVFIKFSIARGQMGEGKMECERNVIVMGEDIIDD